MAVLLCSSLICSRNFSFTWRAINFKCDLHFSYTSLTQAPECTANYVQDPAHPQTVLRETLK